MFPRVDHSFTHLIELVTELPPPYLPPIPVALRDDICYSILNSTHQPSTLHKPTKEEERYAPSNLEIHTAHPCGRALYPHIYY